jgi:hypothetical protein
MSSKVMRRVLIEGNGYGANQGTLDFELKAAEAGNTPHYILSDKERLIDLPNSQHGPL